MTQTKTITLTSGHAPDRMTMLTLDEPAARALADLLQRALDSK